MERVNGVCRETLHELVPNESVEENDTEKCKLKVSVPDAKIKVSPLEHAFKIDGGETRDGAEKQHSSNTY